MKNKHNERRLQSQEEAADLGEGELPAEDEDTVALDEAPAAAEDDDGCEDEFSTERKRYDFKIDGRRYYIRELNGLGRDNYLNSMRDRTKYVDGKPAGVRDFKGLTADLLKLCMLEADTKRLVSVNFIQSLPSSLQTKLFNKARDLSGLGKEAEEEAKND